MHEKIRKIVKYFQHFADRFWYPPFIGFLAALDNFVVVIPNDGILISSAMLVPKRWLSLAFFVTVGSTLGALLLAQFVDKFGIDLILDWYPSLIESQSWLLTKEFFERYGLYLVFFVALTPLAQQPAVILAALVHTPIKDLLLVIFFGRLIKFMIMSYLGSHAPNLLKKLWGLKDELKDTGVIVE